MQQRRKKCKECNPWTIGALLATIVKQTSSGSIRPCSTQKAHSNDTTDLPVCMEHII